MNGTDFTKGGLMVPLIKFSLPILLALLLQSLYGAIDLLIVGQFSDSASVSAVSTGGQTMFTMQTIIIGLSMGVTILMGQLLGQKKDELVSRVVGASICLFALIAVIMTAGLVLLTRPLAMMMQAPPEAMEQTVSYIRICSYGFVFVIAFNLLGGVFRGVGNAKMPLVTVAIASVSNIFGDLLLVAKFHMGAAGAAIATAAAQALSVVLSLLIIRKLSMPFRLTRQHIRFDRRWIGQIMKLGIPLGLQDLLVSVSFLFIVALVNTLGVTASAGVGVAGRLVGFIMLVPSSFQQSLATLVAQNYGARRMDRANRALRGSIVISVACGVVLFYLVFFHGALLSGIFSRDAAVTAASGDYLKVYGFDILLTSFMFCFVGYFNGIGRTRFVMFQGILGGVGIRIPLAFLFSRVLVPVTLFKIGLATPIASVVQVVLCVIYFRFAKRKAEEETAGLPGGGQTPLMAEE